MNRNEALAEYHRTGNYGLREDSPQIDQCELVADWLQSLKDDRQEVMDGCERLFMDTDFARMLCEAALRGDTLTLSPTDWPLDCLADRLVEMYSTKAQNWHDDKEAWEA